MCRIENEDFQQTLLLIEKRVCVHEVQDKINPSVHCQYMMSDSDYVNGTVYDI